MKTKKQLLLTLVDKLGLEPRLNKKGSNENLSTLNDDLSNLSEVPNIATILKDRNYLQDLVNKEELIPCVLMQSLIELSITAGVESYKYELWESLQDQDSLLGIVEKIYISAS